MRFWLLTLAASVAASGAFAKPRKPKHHESDASAVSTGDPNGAWTIDATTSVGNCPALIPNSLQIADNKIASASGADVSPWGYVHDDGVIVARFTAGGDRIARFHGTLRGSKGSGAWSSSTDMCGGTWRASR